MIEDFGQMTYDECQHRRAAARFLIHFSLWEKKGNTAQKLAEIAGRAGLFSDAEVLKIKQLIFEGVSPFDEAELTWESPLTQTTSAVIV
jgi:hypothetical protein